MSAAKTAPAYTPGKRGALVPAYVIPIKLEQLAVELVAEPLTNVVDEQ